jgi:small GTP-binding protein
MKRTFRFKTVLLGDTNVGKTSLAVRFSGGEFVSGQEPTVAAAFTHSLIRVDAHRTIQLDVWDSAGQERFRAMTSMYYRGAKVAYLVYSVVDRASFDGAKRWHSELRSKASRDLICMLVGNKCDLRRHDNLYECVPTDEAAAWAAGNGCMFLEVSARVGLNIDTALRAVCLGHVEHSDSHHNHHHNVHRSRLGQSRIVDAAPSSSSSSSRRVASSLSSSSGGYADDDSDDDSDDRRAANDDELARRRHARRQRRSLSTQRLHSSIDVQRCGGDNEMIRTIASETRIDVRGVAVDVRVRLEFDNNSDMPWEAVFLHRVAAGATLCGMTVHVDKRRLSMSVRHNNEADRWLDNHNASVPAFRVDTVDDGASADAAPSARCSAKRCRRAATIRTSLGVLPARQVAVVELRYVAALDGTTFHLPDRTATSGTIFVSVHGARQAARLVESSHRLGAVGTRSGDGATLALVYRAEPQPEPKPLAPGQEEARALSPASSPSAALASSTSPFRHMTLDEPAARVGDAFHLRIERRAPAAEQPAVFAERDARSASALLLAMHDPPPPWQRSGGRKPLASQIQVLVDRSSTVAPRLWRRIRRALAVFLRSLPSGTLFNLIGFGNGVEQVFPMPAVANQANASTAFDELSKWQANMGGADLLQALEHVFERTLGADERRRDGIGASRLLIITDGQVPDSAAIVKLIAERAESTQTYTLGIGGTVSIGVIESMARAGAGLHRIVDDERSTNACVAALLGQTKHILALDIEPFSVIVRRGADDDDAPVPIRCQAPRLASLASTPCGTVPRNLWGRPLSVASFFDAAALDDDRRVALQWAAADCSALCAPAATVERGDALHTYATLLLLADWMAGCRLRDGVAERAVISSQRRRRIVRIAQHYCVPSSYTAMALIDGDEAPPYRLHVLTEAVLADLHHADHCQRDANDLRHRQRHRERRTEISASLAASAGTSGTMSSPAGIGTSGSQWQYAQRDGGAGAGGLGGVDQADGLLYHVQQMEASLGSESAASGASVLPMPSDIGAALASVTADVVAIGTSAFSQSPGIGGIGSGGAGASTFLSPPSSDADGKHLSSSSSSSSCCGVSTAGAELTNQWLVRVDDDDDYNATLSAAANGDLGGDLADMPVDDNFDADLSDEEQQHQHIDDDSVASSESDSDEEHQLSSSLSSKKSGPLAMVFSPTKAASSLFFGTHRDASSSSSSKTSSSPPPQRNASSSSAAANRTPPPPRQLFFRLVRSQLANGSWPITENVVSALNIPLDHLEALLRHAKTPCAIVNDAWITSVAIAFLQLFYADARHLWDLIAAKSTLWLDQFHADVMPSHRWLASARLSLSHYYGISLFQICEP